jgi:hypothetical protein
MNDSDRALEEALASLRPRAPGAHVVVAIARELDPPAGRRGVIIAWTAGFSAAAAAAGAILFLTVEPAAPESPAYQLVRAEQSPAQVQLFAPVRLDDGSYARPVRVRWDNTTHWEDPRSHTQFINYRPNEQLGLVPLETY